MKQDPALISETGPWPETTWNFRDIPDEEVIACCLWEYALESQTLVLAAEVRQMMTRQFRRHETPPPTAQELARWAETDAAVQREVRRRRFDHGKFMQRFWSSDFGQLRFYDSLCTFCTRSAPAYQRLPRRFRRYLVRQVRESTTLSSLTEALVCDLERLWMQNSVELREIRARERSPDDDSEDFALYQPSQAVVGSFTDERPSDRTINVGFTIDFSRFADAEIEAAFRRWLKTHRPRRWRRPAAVLLTAARRGRKLNDYRVALDRLGLMRLLHGATPSEMRENIPAAWKLYGAKEPDFRREVRAAVRFFRERFPFLPARERPISERRFTTWWREVEKKFSSS